MVCAPVRRDKALGLSTVQAHKPSHLYHDIQCTSSQKEITCQTNLYLVILSSKTYVFEDKISISQFD